VVALTARAPRAAATRKAPNRLVLDMVLDLEPLVQPLASVLVRARARELGHSEKPEFHLDN